MDHSVVKRLRAEVGDRLREQRRVDAAAGLPPMSGEDERQFARALIAQALEEHARSEITAGRVPPSAQEEEQLAAAVHAALFGVGRLQPLLEDAQVENIDINGCDRVFVGYADGREVLRRAGRRLRRGPDRAHPGAGRLRRPVQPAVRLRQPATRPAAAGRVPAVRGDGRGDRPVGVDPPQPARQVFLADLVGSGTLDARSWRQFPRAAVTAPGRTSWSPAPPTPARPHCSAR